MNDSTRFTSMDLDPRDGHEMPFGLDTHGIVDAVLGGVIAYCHADNAQRIVQALSLNPYDHLSGEDYTPTEGDVIDIDGEIWKFDGEDWSSEDYAPNVRLGTAAAHYDFAFVKRGLTKRSS